VAAWLDLAVQFLRSDLRRSKTWRNRSLLVLLCALAGAWAALAPQASFNVGERLRLGFQAAGLLSVAAGILFAFAPHAEITRDEAARPVRRKLFFAAATANFVRGGTAMLPGLPFAIGIASESEVLFILALLAAAALLAATNKQIIALPFLAAFFIPNWSAHWTRLLLEFSLLLLLAAHLFTKIKLCSSAANLKVQNLAHELVTGASVEEICARLQALAKRRARPFVFALCGLNILALVLIAQCPFPISADERKVVELLLIAGVGLLFLDARALLWKGLLLGIAKAPVRATLLFVLALPWAIAWLFYSLHTGEPIGMNEGAAMLVIWLSASAAASSITGSTAKTKLLNSLRELVSQNL